MDRDQMNAIRDLADTAERFLELTATECAVQPGHDSMCDCLPHQQVRMAAQELRLVIAQVRGA